MVDIRGDGDWWRLGIVQEKREIDGDASLSKRRRRLMEMGGS